MRHLVTLLLLTCFLTFSFCDDVNSKTVPGIESIQTGYDIVKGEGSLSPVFKMNYDSGKTYYNPLDKHTYAVPDEVDVSSINHVELDAVQTVVDHYSLYVKQVYEASWTGIDIGIPGVFGLAFKYNKEMGEVHAHLKDKMHTMANGMYSYNMYQLVGTMPEFMELDETFSMFLGMLPKTIKTADDQQLYNELITSYGTHVAYKSVMGGRVHLNTFLDQSYVGKKDAKWVAEQLSFSFQYHLYDIGFHYFHNKSEIHVDKEFTANSEDRMFFYGGDPAYQNQGDQKRWLRTVVDMPFALNATLTPLWNLIPDQHVAENVKQTAHYYIKENKLPEAPVNAGLLSVGLEVDATGSLNPIPGADFLGHGVDETNLGVPLKPIVDFTYDHGTVYQNPVYPELKWKVPDQVPEVENTPESLDLNGTFIFDEVQDYVRWTYDSSSSSGLFSSHSKTTVKFYERYYEQDQAMSLIMKEYSWYTLVLPPFPPPKPSAALDSVLARMPATYDTAYNKRLWQDFISTFGTAFYTKAVLGGNMKCQTWFHKCFLSMEKAKWVSEQSGWSVFGIIGHGHMKKKSQEKIDKNFNEYHETTVDFNGGDETIPADKWEDWVKTIKRAPAPVESKVMGMENILHAHHPELVSAFQAAKQDHQKKVDAANKKAASKYKKKGQHKTPSWCHPRQ